MVEEEDDLLLDAEEASAIDQNKTAEHSVIAMAWSHSKAPQGTLILAFCFVERLGSETPVGKMQQTSRA